MHHGMEAPLTSLLDMRGIRKRFPGVVALDGVDFAVERGEVHALMGENGAGKSTLIKVLTGVHRPDAGAILLDGIEVRPQSPSNAQALGLSTVYQEVNLIHELSVAENISLGREPMRGGRIVWREVRREAERALETLDVRIDVMRPLRSYSIAIQQMTAIARSLSISAKLLILDEPTSSLDRNETDRLFGVVRRLRDGGMGIVFITHFLDQVFEISDRITVLRNGGLVGTYPTAGVSRIELVARMLGKEPEEAMASQETPVGQRSSGEPFLLAEGLGRKGAIAPFDLDIAQGETVGLAGLLGSGRTEIARLLFGLDKPDAGMVFVDGRRASLNPRRAVQAGFGFCPENRAVAGIIPNLSVRENIILALQGSRGWFRALPRQRQEQIAAHYIRALSIATPNAEQPVKNLSGGSQQKVILARWLASDPRFLILDEPTRGIDVGAKAEIERLIGNLCSEGKAILFISSELEEVVRSSDRVLVLRDRAAVAELRGTEVSETAVMWAIAGQEGNASSGTA